MPGNHLHVVIDRLLRAIDLVADTRFPADDAGQRGRPRGLDLVVPELLADGVQALDDRVGLIHARLCQRRAEFRIPAPPVVDRRVARNMIVSADLRQRLVPGDAIADLARELEGELGLSPHISLRISDRNPRRPANLHLQQLALVQRAGAHHSDRCGHVPTTVVPYLATRLLKRERLLLSVWNRLGKG